MRHGLFLVLLATAGVASAQNRAVVKPAELTKALNEFAAAMKMPAVRPEDVRVVRCIGPEEEPTEFECTWKLRTAKGWSTRKNWLAIDGKGWHVID